MSINQKLVTKTRYSLSLAEIGANCEIMSVLEKCHNGAVLGKLEKSHKGAACLFWRKVTKVLIWERRRKVIMVQKTPPTLFWEKCHNGAFAVSNQHHYDFSPEQT